MLDATEKKRKSVAFDTTPIPVADDEIDQYEKKQENSVTNDTTSYSPPSRTERFLSSPGFFQTGPGAEESIVGTTEQVPERRKSGTDVKTGIEQAKEEQQEKVIIEKGVQKPQSRRGTIPSAPEIFQYIFGSSKSEPDTPKEDPKDPSPEIDTIQQTNDDAFFDADGGTSTLPTRKGTLHSESEEATPDSIQPQPDLKGGESKRRTMSVIQKSDHIAETPRIQVIGASDELNPFEDPDEVSERTTSTFAAIPPQVASMDALCESSSVAEVPRPLEQTDAVSPPPTPPPNTTKRHKAKVRSQRVIRKARYLVLHPFCLQALLGRELAEPTGDSLKTISERAPLLPVDTNSGGPLP